MDPVPNATQMRLEKILERMATPAAMNTGKGLSTMLGRPITMSVPRLTVAALSEVPERVGGAEQEAVGIYLMMLGDMTAHVMLILPVPDALRLVDMLMEVPEGTTEDFGAMERSALAEVGNVATSMFLNAIADATGLSVRPSPPAVMIDMVGAILNIILVSAGAVSNEILLMEAEFHGPDRCVELYFWLVPAPILMGES